MHDYSPQFSNQPLHKYVLFPPYASIQTKQKQKLMLKQERDVLPKH